MASSPSPAGSACFGSFRLDLNAGELVLETGTIRLQEQPFQLLLALLQNPGTVLTREEIRSRLWPGNTTVEFDHGIDTAVKKLRRALGDDAARPCYIETIPRRGYRWLTEVRWDQRKNTPESVPTENRNEPLDSIAVLPFTNLSPNSESDYFSEGLAEEILNALTGIPGLKVIARTSSFAFRGKNQDIRAIGEMLGVRTILEGSVRRDGARLRVTVQLVETAGGSHLWSEQYDRELIGVFAVQEEISRAIVKKLNHPGATGSNGIQQAANIESYDAYLKGRHCFAKVTPQAASQAAAFFKEAISLDPQYAPAYSGLARCFFVFAQFGVKPALLMMPQARAAALQAVELNAMDSEAHAILGQVAGAFDYDWIEAMRRCRLALACQPLTHMAQHWCAQFILLPLRRLDEVIALLERLLIADPFALFPRKTLADAFAMRGEVSRAKEELRRLIELDQHFWLAWFSLGNTCAEEGNERGTIEAYEKALERSSFPPLVGSLAAAYTRSGDLVRALSLLARMEPENQPKALLFYYLGCSEFERAAEYLERLMDVRDPDAICISLGSAHCRKSSRICALIDRIYPAGLSAWN